MNYGNVNTARSDRFSIYGLHEEVVTELSKKLDLSVDDVLSAVQEVGFDSEDIEEYIRDRYNRT